MHFAARLTCSTISTHHHLALVFCEKSSSSLHARLMLMIFLSHWDGKMLRAAAKEGKKQRKFIEEEEEEVYQQRHFFRRPCIVMITKKKPTCKFSFSLFPSMTSRFHH